MQLSDEQRAALAKPLDDQHVRVKTAGSKKYPYLPQFTAKRTMNEIFMPTGWSYTVTRLDHLGSKPFKNSEGREGVQTAYLAVVRLSVAGAEYEDVGYGDSVEYTHSLPTHEGAAKEAVSDALKRCMMNLGDQLGLSLWDKESDDHQGALGRGSRPQARQQAEPRLVDEKAKRRVLAVCGELKITDDERHRLVFFVTRGRSSSTNDLRVNEVTTMVNSLKFYREHAEQAEKELLMFEADPEAYVKAEREGRAA